MQVDKKQFDSEKHETFRALTVKQPYASDLVTAIREEGGHNYAIKSIEVRSVNTKYRGDILICSSKNPVIPGLDSSSTLGIVELYDVKKVSDFTKEDWKLTRIPEDKRADIKGGFGWLMRNPRRVIEFPVKGQLGIYNIYFTKGIIIEYPVVLDFKHTDISTLVNMVKDEKSRI